MEYYLGVDLGGTKILTAAADDKGEIITRKKHPTEVKKGSKQVIENIKRTIIDVLKEAAIDKKEVSGLGIGAPGPLDINKGIIFKAPNLDWSNMPIVEILEKEIGIPVFLENDANAAALGEKWFGAGKDAANLLYVTVSTGIGGGFIFDGKIYHGASDVAGEIGHMVIDPDGALCGCGNRGCFEAMASGTAIARMGREAVRKGEKTLLKQLSNNEPEQIDAGMIARAAREGDRVSLEIWEKASFLLGLGLANLLNILNPQMLILGGGVMKARDLFWDKMLMNIENFAFKSSFASVDICQSVLDDNTGVKGAIAVAMKERNR